MKVDPQTIEQLNAINKKYIDAANNHDAAARAALYTEDAVFVTHSGPLYGRQASRNSMQTNSRHGITKTLTARSIRIPIAV